MKYLIPLFALLVLVGCEENKTSDAPPAEPTKVTQADTPVDTVPPIESVQDPDRINQLKDLEVREVGTPKGDVKVWIMDNDSKRMEGMMFLRDEEVKDEEGMLFVFASERDSASSFWMKNTVLPLDIAYLTKDGTVINVGEGKPFSEDQVPPKASYWYVLEMKKGQARKFGVKAGAKLKLPSGLIAQG